jgi:2-phosphosulfolactate phosphatase
MFPAGSGCYDPRMPALHVHLLPSLLTSRELSESVCVIIDVLRASSTIIHALGQGAQGVIPCLNVEDAQAAARNFPAGTCLFGGERHGQLIPGFDLDNSPLRYVPAVVKGKTIVFTTTNGTRALWECRNAWRIVIGAFVNQTALIQQLEELERDVHLVCAGTDGRLTAEDILFAGAVATQLQARRPGFWTPCGVQTALASDFYQMRSTSPEQFRQAFFESDGAMNLQALGMTADIERCLERDLFECVPAWNAATGLLT